MDGQEPSTKRWSVWALLGGWSVWALPGAAVVAALLALLWGWLQADYALALTAATLLLVAATLLLAQHTAHLTGVTRTMGEATNRLARIEAIRDSVEGFRREREMLDIKIEVAEQLLGLRPDAFFPPVHKEVGAEWYEGAPPETAVKLVGQLHRVLKPAEDSSLKLFLNRISSVYDNMKLGARYPTSSAADAREAVRLLREQLQGDLGRWRDDIVQLRTLEISALTVITP